ncbi:MAG: UDP-N-acetylmuramoyl-tripeptide--D-alanyl-D-alanine ligase [Acidimicrobiia bacterium]
MKWDLAAIASATGGHATGAATVDRVVVDSREAGPGSLFVAVRGERFDGNDFAADAAARGAAVLVERSRLPAGALGVEVDDTRGALARLGERRRSEIIAPFVAITGSSGKTTTKDMTAAALGVGTHSAPRSFNNEVGVPLTVLGAPDDASAVVVEVGSRGAGHISALAAVVRPDVAVVTNIGPAHLEMFGDVASVLEAKWELVDALGPEGVAVLPAADPRLTSRRTGAMITFGEDESGADVEVSDVSLDGRGCASFRIAHLGSASTISLVQPGRHQPVNAAAAIAAALALGRDFAEAADRVALARTAPWRMEVREVAVADGAILLVNDAYNANPDSMRAAFATVAAMSGRRIAVLGKMHELGTAEGELHRAIGRSAIAAGFAIVIVVGDDPGIAVGAGSASVVVSDAAEAVSALAEIVRPGDVVLVKGSRAAGLEAVAEAIEGAAA